ncbi:MAG TPA: amidohydrolase [Parvularculaceae bacterium]|nr:amidohydrolase [Parvularculaceae bacterium]
MSLIRFTNLAVLTLAGIALAACARESAPAPAGADTVFFGGPIYTALDAEPTIEAVAVKGGVIEAAGARAEIDKLIGPSTRIIDLKGAAMYPGFTDSHAHLLGIGMRELTLNLEGVGSVEELVDIVAANVAETKPGALVYGRGWIETGWPEGRFPNRDDLDPMSADNPVILYRADGHAAVTNSAALAAAGVDENTPDPTGGRIEKDVNGRPTGMLIDNAMNLVGGLLSEPTAAQKREAYNVASEVYTGYGWTGVHNMSVDPDDAPLLEEMSDGGSLKLRVYNALDQGGLEALAKNGARKSANDHVITRAIKLYVDGALGSRGAALLAPYSDQPETSGLMLMQKEEAEALFEKAISSGVQICTHAIGDRGNRLVLDWYDEAFSAHPEATNLRWRIEHAQILDTNDIPRLAELGVIPSMQPSHAIGDLYFAPARLGADRLAGAYAWRSLIDTGSIIAGGTDAPVERGDPRIEFYAAVARKSLDGYSDENWRPEQAVSRSEALKMFTAWPAYASFQEEALGVIAPGKRADFTVFSGDIMTIPAEEILKVEPVMTVVDGEIVYEASTE